MKQTRVALVATLVGAIWLPLASCGREQPEVPAAEVARAEAALQPFKEQLLDALMTSLEAGPENAIEVCRKRAPQIAEALSVDGLRMGRTSHRLRNPANAPQEWVRPLLAAYVENPASPNPMTVWVDEKTVGYVEPIFAVSFCISCHGPAVGEELLGTIRELYPEDQAIGFRTGDLRGLFWLTMPAVQEG